MSDDGGQTALNTKRLPGYLKPRYSVSRSLCPEAILKCFEIDICSRSQYRRDSTGLESMHHALFVAALILVECNASEQAARQNPCLPFFLLTAIKNIKIPDAFTRRTRSMPCTFRGTCYHMLCSLSLPFQMNISTVKYTITMPRRRASQCV